MQNEAAKLKAEIKKFKLVKRDAITKVVTEIIEGDDKGNITVTKPDEKE